MRKATRGGVAALALRAAACVRPWARPHRGVPPGCGGGPARFGARRGRLGRGLAEAGQSATRNQGDEAAGKTREQRCAGENHPAQRERKPRPKFVANPSAEQLDQRIRIGVSGEREAQFGVGQLEVGPDRPGSGGDVHAIDVKNEVHDAQQGEDAIRCLEELQVREHVSLPPNRRDVDRRRSRGLATESYIALQNASCAGASGKAAGPPPTFARHGLAVSPGPRCVARRAARRSVAGKSARRDGSARRHR